MVVAEPSKNQIFVFPLWMSETIRIDLLLSVNKYKAQEITYNHEINCSPSVEKALDNLYNLQNFLEYDTQCLMTFLNTCTKNII